MALVWGVLKLRARHATPSGCHTSKPFAYEYEWPHRNAAELAAEVWNYLGKTGITTKQVERGVYNGIWVPSKVMLPPDEPIEMPTCTCPHFMVTTWESQIHLKQVLQSLQYVLVVWLQD